MLDAAAAALGTLLTVEHMAWLMLGVVVGVAIGIVPVLGGFTGLVILLPLTFSLDTASAMALLIGMLAAASTGDTAASVLFGIPGGAASQATILDGYPMTRRGEAGRALSAGYLACMLGGLFGAALLAVSIPVLRPIVLLFGAPELFMLCAWGLIMVAAVSRGALVKGLIVAGLGVLLSQIGQDPKTGYFIWTYDTLYLWSGIPIAPLALGLYAIPEITTLIIGGTSIAKTAGVGLGAVLKGARDNLENWGLLLRCSVIGAWIGALPALGAFVSQWMAYAHAVATCRGGGRTFGKGDVRGVIAAESTNNSSLGGELIPTLAFGVPGSPAMALMLAAFTIQGMRPGPEMLTKHLDTIYLLVFSLALANVLGAAIMLALGNVTGRLVGVPPRILAAFLIPVVVLSGFQTQQNWGDLGAMMAFAVLGMWMKVARWPRPPLIIGFVLGLPTSTYLFTSIAAFGGGWLMRPSVLIIAAMIVASLLYAMRQMRVAARLQQQLAPGLTLAADDG